jgi:hypothetical protein
VVPVGGAVAGGRELLRDYLRATARHVYLLLVGIIGVLLLLVSLALPTAWRASGFILLAIGVFGAQFLAWRDMRHERDEAINDREALAHAWEVERAGAEAGRYVRDGLARHIESLGIRMHIIAETAQGNRPERPELPPPAPTGDERIDQLRLRLYEVTREAEGREDPPWKANAIRSVFEARDFLRTTLGYDYVTRFDFPLRETPTLPIPFNGSPEMADLWKELALRQERLLRFLEEQPR